MVKFIYSLYDDKAKCYANIFTSANDFTALRSLAAAAQDTSSEIFRFPTDFTLYQLGTWDDSNGTITSNPEAINLGKASQFNQGDN